MLKSLRNLMLAAAAIAIWNFGAAVTGQVQAASDCPRGSLDERYCDVDGI